MVHGEDCLYGKEKNHSLASWLDSVPGMFHLRIINYLEIGKTNILQTISDSFTMIFRVNIGPTQQNDEFLKQLNLSLSHDNCCMAIKPSNLEEEENALYIIRMLERLYEPSMEEDTIQKRRSPIVKCLYMYGIKF